MAHRPLIGLNSDVRACTAGSDWAAVPWPYVEALAAAGAVPLIVPPSRDRALLEQVLDLLDGLILTGGRDLPPAWYGQEAHPRTQPADPRRLAGDRLLAQMALQRDLPILGICLGCQLLNVVLGGDLVQDIPTQVETTIRHAVPKAPAPAGNHPTPSNPNAAKRPVETFHPVRVEAGSRLVAILGRETLEVNSSHHQALGRLGRGLRATAWAPDGVIEAAEAASGRFLLAVQWHPERIVGRPEQRALFEALVETAAHDHPQPR